MKWLPALYTLLTLLMSDAHAGKSATTFSDGKIAASVMGQTGFTSGDANRGGTRGANTLNAIEGIAIDPATGKVFIGDRSNNRVLRFTSMAAMANGADAEAALGQTDFTSNAQATTQNGMNRPTGVAIDSGGRLWVADLGNHRVLRFDDAANKTTGANADGVLGQGNFTTGSSATTRSGMNTPLGIAIDSSGRLWVADLNNDRVLRFDNAAAKGNGADADGVLGRSNFTTSGPQLSQGGMDSPIDVAVDTSGRLWVVDAANQRILRFDNAAGKADGANADGVLGQALFTTKDQGTTANTMMGPQGAVADANGRLWVADRSNNRVLRFDDAAAKADGADADGVLGQTSFTSNTPATTRSGMDNPMPLAAEGTRLWVGDRSNNRVVRFETDTYQPDGQIGAKKKKLKGNGIYNGTGSGQKAKVKMEGNRPGKVFYVLENDGDAKDDFTITGTKGNRKLKVKYLLTPGGNVTGAMTRGGHILQSVGSGAKISLKAKISATRTSRDKRASRNLKISSVSRSDGESDTVRAKVKKVP